MLEALRMFARHGYAAVSMRDIAEKVAIKHASIYSHFQNKEALYEAVLERIESAYGDFYVRLVKDAQKSADFEQVLDCLIDEVFDAHDYYVHHGFGLIASEQFRDERAGKIFRDVLMRAGVAQCKALFDACVAREWIRPLDTQTLAMHFHNGIIMGTMLRTHAEVSHAPADDARRMLLSMKRCVLCAVAPPP